MSLLAAIGLTLSLLASPATSATNDAITIDKRVVGKLVKGIADYYHELDEQRRGKAHSEYKKLLKELEKAAPDDEDVSVLLTNVEQWREILRESSIPEKPILTSGKAKFGQPEKLPCPLNIPADELDNLGSAFGNELLVFVSCPKDFKKEPKPVILALHPITAQEKSVKFKEMRSSRDIVGEVEDWVETAYSQEVLDTAIVVVPVLDLARADGALTAARATWDGPDGLRWAMSALNQLVLNGAPHDPSRVFIDGHGDIGSRAVSSICSRFPSMLTGGIIRGAPADDADFRNCRGMPILFAGESCKEFAEKWQQEEGYAVQYVDAIDSGAEVEESASEADEKFPLAGWLAQGSNTKNFAPTRVELYTSNAHGTAYWLSINGFSAVENVKTAEIIAEIDRDQNRITVTTNPLVSGFRIALNDQILDLDKEITIVHKRAGDEGDGEVRFKGTVRRSFQELLDMYFYKAHGNVGEAYLALVDVDAE